MNEENSMPKSYSFGAIAVTLITVILVAAVLFQSFEIQKVKGYAQGLLQIQSASAAGVSTQSVTPSARPASSSLPSQVGGC